MPKSLVSFAFQSNYVGLGLMCKRVFDLLFSTRFHGDVKRDYPDHIESMMMSEQTLVFQVICLLGTHLVNTSRTAFHL